MDKRVIGKEVQFRVAAPGKQTACLLEFENNAQLKAISLSAYPKSLFFDLDGTVIGKSGEISSRTTKCIEQVQGLGLTVSIATGRPYFAATDIIPYFGDISPSMFFAGALVIDPKSNEILRSSPLTNSEVLSLVSFAEGRDWYTELYTLDDYFIERENPDYAQAHFHYLKRYPKPAKFSELVEEQEIVKIGFILPIGKADAAQEELEKSFPELAFTAAAGAAHADIMFINATSKEASRKNAFETLTKHLGVSSEETIAFGDGEADKTFLSLAGCGVAMVDGNEHAKNSADALAHSVEEEGVAIVLEALSDMLERAKSVQ